MFKFKKRYKWGKRKGRLKKSLPVRKDDIAMTVRSLDDLKKLRKLIEKM